MDKPQLSVFIQNLKVQWTFPQNKGLIILAAMTHKQCVTAQLLLAKIKEEDPMRDNPYTQSHYWM